MCGKSIERKVMNTSRFTQSFVISKIDATFYKWTDTLKFLGLVIVLSDIIQCSSNYTLHSHLSAAPTCHHHYGYRG